MTPKNWTEKEQLSLQSFHPKNKAKYFDKKIIQSLTPQNKKLRIRRKSVHPCRETYPPQVPKYDVNDTEHGLSSPSAKIKQAACPTTHAPQ